MSRTEFISILFLTYAAVVKTAVMTLITKVRNVSAKVSFTLVIRWFGILRIRSIYSTKTPDTRRRIPAIIRSAARTELKITEAFFLSPL